MATTLRKIIFVWRLYALIDHSMYHHLRPLRLTTLSHIAQKVLVTAPVDLVRSELVLGTADTLEVLCLCLPDVCCVSQTS